MSYDFKTSRPAYEDAKQNLGAKQQQIYQAIAVLEIVSDRQLAEYLDIPINQVTPRRNELVEMKMIQCAGIYTDPISRRKVRYWKVKEPVMTRLKQNELYETPHD